MGNMKKKEGKEETWGDSVCMNSFFEVAWGMKEAARHIRPAKRKQRVAMGTMRETECDEVVMYKRTKGSANKTE